MHSTILFIFASFWITTQAQTWTGTFQMNSTCILTTCCCLVNDIVITRPTTSVLALNTSLAGVCLGLTSYAGTTNYPSGYSFSLTISLITLGVTLSSDSSMLSMTNSFMAQCSGTAVRKMATVPMSSTVPGNTPPSSAMRQYTNMMMLLALVVFNCMKYFY